MEIYKEFDDICILIKNDNYSKSEITIIDTITSEKIHSVSFNTAGSIEHIADYDDMFYVTNCCGYMNHEKKSVDTSVFNNLLEVSMISKDLTYYKKVGQRIENIYSVAGLFVTQFFVSVFVITKDNDIVRCDRYQFSRNLRTIGIQRIFSLRLNRKKFPHIDLTLTDMCSSKELCLDEYLPVFPEYSDDTLTMLINLEE